MNDVSISFEEMKNDLLKDNEFKTEFEKLNPRYEETIAAFNEVEEMKKNPSIGKSYTDVDKMMEDLLSWNIPLNQLVYLKNLTDLYIINGNSFLYMIYYVRR